MSGELPGYGADKREFGLNTITSISAKIARLTEQETETDQMNNPFQEQLLKAGVVSEQQVKKAQQEKKKNKQQQPKGKKHKQKVLSEAEKKAREQREAKAQRDRELNERKQQQAKAKALSAEINQMIRDNMIKRDESCEIAYNFEHQKKVKRIYINEDMKKKIIQGKLGIARIDGVYELVPIAIAEKIAQRNEKRVVIFKEEEKQVDENDPYAGYEVPDDLIW